MSLRLSSSFVIFARDVGVRRGADERWEEDVLEVAVGEVKAKKEVEGMAGPMGIGEKSGGLRLRLGVGRGSRAGSRRQKLLPLGVQVLDYV